MQPRFGFHPSNELACMIDEAFERSAKGASSGEPMYPMRNALIEKVTDELIDNFVTKLADEIDEGDDRADQIRKLGSFLQKTTRTIVKAMLSKDKDDVVLQSAEFLRDTVARDSEGKLRIGAKIEQSFYDSIKRNFELLRSENPPDDIRKHIAHNLNKFDSILLQHFLLDFVETLGWGAIKRNLAKGAKATMSGANGMLIESMVPRTSIEDLRDISPFIEKFFFETDEPIAYPKV